MDLSLGSNETWGLLPETNFGPSATGRFDFTRTFESAILSILPCSLFLLLAPVRLVWLARQPNKVASSRRALVKLGLLFVYAALQLTVLLYWACGPDRLLLQVAASALMFINGVLLLVVSHAEHTRSLHPSTLITVYLLLTLLFDCTVARSLWLLPGLGVIARLVITTTVVKFLVLVAEVWEKRSILLSQYRDVSPEMTSSFFNLGVYWWLNPLLRTGFGRFLTFTDLYPIHESMSARKLLSRGQKMWRKANTTRQNSLSFATMRATKTVFASGVLARLFLIAFKFAVPFLIKATTAFSQDAAQPDASGWGLTAAWFLVLTGRAISTAFFHQMQYRFVTSVRGTLCGLIYGKTLGLSVMALDESSAVTLMSTDTENICDSVQTLHELWASPTECGVALYLLYKQLGLAALAPIVVTIIATICIMQLATYMGQAQKQWVRGIQTRVDVTASVLGSMKEVKMLGFTDIINGLVQDLRVKELRLSRAYRRLLCLRILIATMTQTIAPLATFATFVIISRSTGQPLDTGSAYTSLSLVYLLTDPMMDLIRIIPRISAALACFHRVQTYLLSKSREDYRVPLNMSVTGEMTKASENYERSGDIELRDLAGHSVTATEAPLLVISEASFGWADTIRPVLQDISISIGQSQTTFIIGNVGCGKSTLMRAMLGEIQPLSGRVYSGLGKVAYVGQDPWIQNLTIRENILGVSNHDHEWYATVIQACGLEQDIHELLYGDATKAGSSGVSLSGGQKQRLALARAVYSRAEVVFLDDVFSGQDARTESHIYQSLFGERGLFQAMGTTVVCITGTVHGLVHADRIIALGEDGRVLHQGSFDQLKSDTDYLHGLQLKKRPCGNAGDQAAPSTKDTSIGLPRAPDNDAAPSSMVVGELATYAYYFGSIPGWYTFLFVSAMVVCACSNKMTELLLSFWTAHAEADSDTNGFYLGLYAMLSGLALLAVTAGSYFYLIILVPLTSEVLHARLLRTVVSAPLSFFSKTDIGVTTNRFSQDMSIIDVELPFTLVDLVINLSVLVVGAVLMCVFSGFFAAVVPPVIFFCWLLQKFYLRTSRQMRILDLEAKSPLFTQFLDLLQGLANVRAFGWESQFQDKYLDLLDASQRPYYLLFCIQRWLGVVLDLMVAALATILMVLVVKLRTHFTPQFVALAVLNVMTFSQSLALVIQGWTQLETSIGAVARVKSFCNDTDNENHPSETMAVDASWPSLGHIAIENLTASYTPDGEPVLRGVTLDIPRGSKVGICGRSGSGKSSLLATLLRLLEVTPESRISFDGVDITTLPRQSVRRAVAVVPQNPFFLKNRSIRANLVPRHSDSVGDAGSIDATTDDRILSVLHRLKMRDVVVDRLGGLDSVLDAEKLSQGQRQLLCLARAVLARKKVVLLDEANSNVDERTEMLMRQVIREEFAGCTVVAIVHRLGAVADFDRVAVLGEGRLLEWDAPKALLGRDSGFKRLWDLQGSA